MVRRATTAYSKLLVDRFGVALSLARLPPSASGGRVPVGVAHELLHQAVATTGDPSLGLKAGRSAAHGDGGPLDYAMQTAATVEQALETAARFIRVLNSELDVVLTVRGAQAHVELRTRAPLPRPVEDFVVSALFTVHMQRLLPAARDVTCCFAQAKPRRVAEHERTFGKARLRFGARHAGFVFDATHLSRTLPSSDAKLHAILTHYLERDLRELPDARSWTEQVRQVMDRQTPLMASASKVMASALDTSSRTLARRLRDEGTSFGDLLDEVRRTRALRYIEDEALRVEEIASMLGFSGSSAFHRAFKRWTGESPSEHRRALRTASRRGADGEESWRGE